MKKQDLPTWVHPGGQGFKVSFLDVEFVVDAENCEKFQFWSFFKFLQEELY